MSQIHVRSTKDLVEEVFAKLACPLDGHASLYATLEAVVAQAYELGKAHGSVPVRPRHAAVRRKNHIAA